MFQQLGVTRREVLVGTVPFLALPPSGLGQCYARALPFRREVENNGGARFYAPLETARGPWLAGPTAVVDGQERRAEKKTCPCPSARKPHRASVGGSSGGSAKPPAHCRSTAATSRTEIG